MLVDDSDEDVKNVQPIEKHFKYSFATPLKQDTSYQRSVSVTPGQPQGRTAPGAPDPLGPKAQKDYRQYMSYAKTLPSSRPGGEQMLYDLISGLPMKPFGVLGWSVIDREEELFELVDTRDEDKVMQALWSRWIMLNRR
jgi:hypothetical protein